MSRTTAGILALAFCVVGAVTWWIARESLNAPTAAPATGGALDEPNRRPGGAQRPGALEPKAGGKSPTPPHPIDPGSRSGLARTPAKTSGPAAHRVTFLLIDAVRGGPIPGADVLVDEKQYRADANGTLRITYAPPLYVYVEVRGKGYCTTEFRVAEIAPEGGGNLAEPIRLRVPPAATIEGTLRNADGVVEPDRRILIWLESRDRSPGTDDESVVVARTLHYERENRSDGSGTFRVARLPAGIRLGVRPCPLGCGPVFPGKSVLLAPEETRRVDLMALAAGTVSGRVVDRHGRPVWNARVAAYVRIAPGGRNPGRYGFARSDRFGAFTIPGVPTGKGTLEVRPRAQYADDANLGFAPTEVAFEITRHHEEVYREIVISRELAIRGRVVNEAGEPLASVRVEATARSTVRRSPDQRLVRRATSGADGTFTLIPVSPGLHEVMARGFDDYADSPAVETRGGTSGVVLRLSLACAVRGRVTDAETGEPVCARVTAWPRSSKRGDRTTDTDRQGRFRLDGVLPGRYDLVAVDSTRKRIGVHGRLELTAGTACRGVAILVRRAGALRIESESHSVLDRLRVESAGCTIFAESRFNAAIALPIRVPANQRVHVRAVVEGSGSASRLQFSTAVTVPAGETVTAILVAAKRDG